jgi:hypothetical protein
MLVFVLLTMFMGGVIMLTASLFCLTQLGDSQQDTIKQHGYTSARLVYDDTELPSIPQQAEASSATDESEEVRHSKLMEFTKTSRKSAKQLPLLGLPDKAFYRIH